MPVAACSPASACWCPKGFFSLVQWLWTGLALTTQWTRLSSGHEPPLLLWGRNPTGEEGPPLPSSSLGLLPQPLPFRVLFTSLYSLFPHWFRGDKFYINLPLFKLLCAFCLLMAPRMEHCSPCRSSPHSSHRDSVRSGLQMRSCHPSKPSTSFLFRAEYKSKRQLLFGLPLPSDIYLCSLWYTSFPGYPWKHQSMMPLSQCLWPCICLSLSTFLPDVSMSQYFIAFSFVFSELSFLRGFSCTFYKK